MADTDIIVKDLSIEKKAQFNMLDLYRTLKSWFDLNGYNFFESEYKDQVKGDRKSTSIKWVGEKEINDYFKFIIRISINLPDYELIETEKEKLVDGTVTIKFNSMISSDYTDKWSGKPKLKLSRVIYDKFIATSKKEKLESEIKDETVDLFNKTKTYLNLQKFR